MQNNFMQIYLIQIYLRASSPNTVRIFERCKHVFGGLSNACEIEGEAECDFESRSQGDDPASYPKWAPQMQFRKPQISIPKSTNHFVISAQESRSQGEELVALPSRIHQDPSPAQTGTDQLRTEYWSSSVNLFLVPSLIFFLIWLPLFSSKFHSLPITCLLLKRYHYLELHSTGILRAHVVLRAPLSGMPPQDGATLTLSSIEV